MEELEKIEKERRLNDVFDFWMNMWINKLQPEDFPTYTDWRKFWDFWYEHLDLLFKEALTVYRMQIGTIDINKNE